MCDLIPWFKNPLKFRNKYSAIRFWNNNLILLFNELHVVICILLKKTVTFIGSQFKTWYGSNKTLFNAVYSFVSQQLLLQSVSDLKVNFVNPSELKLPSRALTAPLSVKVPPWKSMLYSDQRPYFYQSVNSFLHELNQLPSRELKE